MNYKLVNDRLKCTSLRGLLTIRIGIDLFDGINFGCELRYKTKN